MLTKDRGGFGGAENRQGRRKKTGWLLISFPQQLTRGIQEGALETLSPNKPAVELFTKHRLNWVEKIEGADQKLTG